MAIQFHQVSSLPGTLQPDSFYYVLNGTYAEAYLTNDAGVARSVGNSTMINDLITAALSTYSGGIVQDVADIAARDALSLDKNGLVMVYDASADASVNSGAAMYYYDESADTWTKAAEYESLDVSLDWANITNKPTSTVTQIDSAVTQAHSHSNKAELDKIGESGGEMTYNGSVLGGSVEFTTNSW